MCCIAFSCDSKKGQATLDYGTKNDSALFYFYKGWEHIMDKGEWTLSEEAFRKAVDHDPDFLIGKSLVARISDSLEERIEIKEVLASQKETLTADGRLLLDVYMLNIDLANARSQSPESLGAIVKDFRALSETNYRAFVHKYPEESYIKAEYIEILHAGYGAQLALDSLEILTSQKEREEHLFFKSYSASLEAELGNYEQALLYANQVLAMSEKGTANPEAVFADIYFKMDSLHLAKKYIDKAVALDPKHIIAQGLKRTIERNIKDTL
jgi:tetratricopeptide (TPR) repeat protein